MKVNHFELFLSVYGMAKELVSQGTPSQSTLAGAWVHIPWGLLVSIR